MTIKLENPERNLLIAIVALLVVALVGPVVYQPAYQHDFADQRLLGYFHNAADVLSNLPFAIWGLVGLITLSKAKLNQTLNATRLGLCALFFFGLIATAFASSWYHMQPDNAGLAVDRLGMAVAFAGLVGLAAADRISQRAGLCLSSLVLVLGCFSVQSWATSGNVLP